MSERNVMGTRFNLPSEMRIENEGREPFRIGQEMMDFGKAVNPNMPIDPLADHEGLKRIYKPKQQGRNIETQTDLHMDIMNKYEQPSQTARYGSSFRERGI